MISDLLIINALLLPQPGGQLEAGLGYVAVHDGRISAVGSMAEMGHIQAQTTIDARGSLVMPGLVNTHCHAAMTLFRGLADDLKLAAWLNEHIFPAEAAKVDPEMVYWCSKLAAAEMILSGTTLVADGYFFEDQAARAFCDTGLRAVAAHGVIDFPAPGVLDPAKNVQTVARFIEEWRDRNPLITPAVFAHSPYTCSAETLQKAKELARTQNVLFFIHTAETRQELSLIHDPRGGSPVKHLDELGLLDDQSVCVHCVWVDEEDIEIMARRRVRVSVCPQSNLKLASGMAPLAAILEHSIIVGLGSDGVASNNGLDLFREMDICAKVQKVRALDPVAVKAGDVVRMTTRDGAAALGFKDLGILSTGSLADLIIVDLDRPHLQPFYGPDLLVYAAGGADVRTVIVNGKLVMRDRRLLTMDLDETMDRVRRLARSMI